MALVLRILPAAFCALLLTLTPPAARAQSDAKSATPGETKDAQRRGDELVEAARVIAGPAGNPECVWLGRRVVNLLWRDDLETAFRHLDLYDRFGCPSAHIQYAFRCVVRQGNIDPKGPDLPSRVHACWLNPAAPPGAAASAPTTGSTGR